MNKVRALAVFSPDALSSIAYANQEIFLGLVIAGSAGLSLAFPIGIAITILLALVAISYFQTIHGYPSGGGSYVVARENLGSFPGLAAGAALLVDYLLTAAVSITAGVAAIASAFPVLWEHRVPLSLGLLAVIMLINLRGVRETGTLMAVPVYLFLVPYLAMLLYGGIRAIVEGPGSLAAAAPPPTAPLGVILVLHAFSTGCTALTGIEAISNGVPAFRPPQSKNAGRTLAVMALLMGVLFLGSTGLTQYFAVIPGDQETILSALARRLLGSGFPYLLIQVTTTLILAVAANTSFAGFPRLTAILAGDGFMPRQLASLGDRLVYSRGIALLSAACGALIVLFDADSHRLVPLFAVGAFMAFLLSQSGMVIHWWRERKRGWWVKAFFNGLGALATAATLGIVIVSKFLEGAWITILLIALLVSAFLRVRSHYREIGQELTLHGLRHPAKAPIPLRVVLPISGVHRGVVQAAEVARSISPNVTAVYIEMDPGTGDAMLKKWQAWFPDIPMVVVASPYRSLIGPLLGFLDQFDNQSNDGQLAAVVLPEFIPAKWWQGLLHNQTAWLIKMALLYRRRAQGYQRVIIDVPLHLRR